MTDPSSIPGSELSEYQLGESVGYLLTRVKSTLSNLVTQRSMAELGITSQQGSILFMVASGKCLLAAELAREYGIDASAVTRLVDRLEKRGLLTRVRSNEDRRVVRLALTPEGHAHRGQNAGYFQRRAGQSAERFHAGRSRLPEEHAAPRARQFAAIATTRA